MKLDKYNPMRPYRFKANLYYRTKSVEKRGVRMATRQLLLPSERITRCHVANGSVGQKIEVELEFIQCEEDFLDIMPAILDPDNTFELHVEFLDADGRSCSQVNFTNLVFPPKNNTWEYYLDYENDGLMTQMIYGEQ